MGKLTDAVESCQVTDLRRLIKKKDDQHVEVSKALEHVTRELEAVRRAKRPIEALKPATKPRTKGDRVRVFFGDLHGCRMKKSAVEAMLGDIKLLDPDEVIMGGDIMEAGGFLAEHHTMGYVHEVQESYDEDIEATNAFLDTLQATVPRARIEYLEGNHEARVEKWILTKKLRSHRDIDFLYRAFGAPHVLHLKERGIAYHKRSETHDGLSIPGWIKRGKLMITHEIASGKNAGGKAVIAAGGNVLFFHTHQRSEGIMDTPGGGVAMAWNPGCLCRRQPLWRHTSPTNWNHGYAVQFVSKSENFIMQTILINEGDSMLAPFLKRQT